MSDVPPYWNEPYAGEFKVSIGVVEKLDDLYHIHINENVIRPAGGGQAGDRGHLHVGNEMVTVLDTTANKDDIVLVTDRPLPENTSGQLEIDMEWRLSMMRNHTAEHLFAHKMKSLNEDMKIGDLWIDGRHGSIELLGSPMDLDTILKAEEHVITIIEQDLPVKTEFIDSDKIDSSVRSREGLTEKHSKLRVVSVGDLDSSACSGVHVTSTKDIGFFKVLDVKTSDKATRVEFVAGMDAASAAASVYNMALRRKSSYPFEMEQLGTVLVKAKRAVDDRQKMTETIIQLLTKGPTQERIDEVSFRYEYLPGFDATALKNLANQLQVDDPTVILLFTPGWKSQVILRVHDMPNEAREYIQKPMQKLGGRGGGKGEVYTGGFSDVEDPLKLYEDLVRQVREYIE